jgi:DNA-binding beta-propeller fold protein YncE
MKRKLAAPAVAAAFAALATSAPVLADVWVASQQHITRYTAAGAIVARATTPFGMPLALDRFFHVVSANPKDGSVWIADYGNGRVLHLGPRAEELLEIDKRPYTIAVDARNDAVWIHALEDSDVWPYNASPILKLDARTGAELVRVTGAFRSPWMAVHPDGSIWVTDEGGALWRLFGTDDELDGYVIEGDSGPHHQLVATFYAPLSLAVNPRKDVSGIGSVWLTAAHYPDPERPDVLVKYDALGQRVLSAALPVGQRIILTSASVNSRNGNVWTANIYGSGAIWRINPLGQITLTRTYVSPERLVVDMTDEGVWFFQNNFDGSNNTVSKLDKNGTLLFRRANLGAVVDLATYPRPIDLDIDIAPSDPNNVVYPLSRGEVHVAFLSSVSPPLDPVQMNLASLRFGPRNAPAKYTFTRDVNKDGILDVVAKFSIAATGIACGDDRAQGSVRVFEGQTLRAIDRLRTAGC